MADEKNKLDGIQDSAQGEVKSFNEGEKSENELLSEFLAYKNGDDSAIRNRKREQDQKDGHHRRSEKQKTVEAWGFSALTVFLILGMIATGCVWLWHTLTPCDWHFLLPKGIEKIERFLFGAFTSGLVSARYFAARKK